MNMYGVPAGRSVTNPFSCTASDLNAFPCSYSDAQHWSRILLAARDAKVQTTINGATVTVDHHWFYSYAMAQVQPQNSWCSTGACPAVWDWGNVNDEDYLDFYNAEFRGFQVVQEVEQEIDSGGGACTTPCTLAVTDHHYITTQGWGVWNQAEIETGPNAPGCWNEVAPNTFSCPTSPYWSSSNMPAGAETQTDAYAGDGTTLSRRALFSYDLNCAPAGDPTTSSVGWGSSDWWTIDPPNNLTHLLVAELDSTNPVAVCDPRLASVQTLLVDGGSLSSAPSTTISYAYDTGQSYSGSHDYGNVTEVDVVASDGGSVGGSGHAIVQTLDYTVNDNISTSATSATGTYIVDTPSQKVIHDGSASGPVEGLSQLFYDGATSLTAPPTVGEGWQEKVAVSPSGGSYTFLTTTSAYDAYGNLIATEQPNGQIGACTLTITVDGSPQSQGFSTCDSYDTGSYTAHVTQETNALGQHTATNTYGNGQDFGFGEWLQSAADANNQTTTYQYDVLGRLTGVTAPGEGNGLLTTQYAYTIWCPATGPNTPCSETDTIQRLDSTTTLTSRTFYDGWGQVAETRTPADDTNDVVAYTTYDAREEALFTSRPYYVSAYSGSPGSGAYSPPDSTQPGSSTVYDALGRPTQNTDPAGATTTINYLQATGPDGATYEGTQGIDANHHQAQTLTDALGRTRYTQTFTGTDPYTLYATTSQNYDFQGHLVTITQPDGVHTTTLSYDLAGRQIGVNDPDSGATSYQLDNDGNITQETDARGDTIFSGYDALDRQLWRNTTNSPTGAYVTYTYDGIVPNGFPCGGIASGTNAIGHVTTEYAQSGPSNSFTYTACSAYDGRGQQTALYNTINTNAVTGQTSFNYDDAGTLTQATYPNGDSEQYTYSAQERLIAVSGYNSTTGQSQLLLSGITYNGAAGPAGLPDSYTLGGTNSSCSAANSPIACVTLSYDADLRLTQATDTQPTTGNPITSYSLGVTYDAVGNVTSLSAALPAAGGQSGGQDNQQFCYDELNRLTWAGDSGTNPCTNQAVTNTTLTNASYTASYTYDVSNRITQSTLTGALASAPQGSYAYDSTHYHAVDAIGSVSYQAQYDANGDMTCRAVTSTQVCTSSSQTGARFTYDVEGRLIEWDSADGTTKVTFGYTGEGARFIQQVVTNGQTTSTTSYLPNEEVVAVPGQQAAVTAYFTYAGKLVAEDQAGHWYYLLTDGLGSIDVVVDATGVIAAQLFGPYGQLRWSGGTMPTTYGFTGQHGDTATGLDYYNARYYDPAAGRFTSADTIIPGGGYDPAGLDAYAYAGNSPTTNIDPSGHDFWCGDSGWACKFLGFLFNVPDIVQEFQEATDSSTSSGDRAWAIVKLEVNVILDVTLVDDFVAKGADLLGKALEDGADQTLEHAAADSTDAARGKGGDSGGSSGSGGGAGGGPIGPRPSRIGVDWQPSADAIEANQRAKAYATELAKSQNVFAPSSFASNVTVGVGRILLDDGSKQWIATLNRGAANFNLLSVFKGLLPADVLYLGPEFAIKGGPHAEAYLIQDALERLGVLTGLGASNNICMRQCFGLLMQYVEEWGWDFIGTPFQFVGP